jgi:hypothetical protein
MSLSVLPIVRNVSDKSYREHQYVHFMFNNFFPPDNHVVYDSVEKYGRASEATDHTIIGHIEVANCMPDNQGKDTDTHSECLKLLLHIW